MAKFMVIGMGPGSKDEMESGMGVWDDTFKEFPDINMLDIFGNFAEHRLICTMEAPSINRISEMFLKFAENWKKAGMPTGEMEAEPQMEILPIDYFAEHDKLIYTEDLEKVKAGA